MNKLNVFKTAMFVTSIVCATTFVASGGYLLTSYLTREHHNKLDKIVIKNVEEDQIVDYKFNDFFPGDTKIFDLKIKSQLFENVKYSVEFKNHELNEIDKDLYVTVVDEKDNLLVSNTLHEVFDQSISINRVLKSRASDTLVFEFRVDEEVSRPFEYSFDLHVVAKGKISN